MKIIVGIIVFLTVFFMSCGPAHKVMKSCKHLEGDFYDCEVP